MTCGRKTNIFPGRKLEVISDLYCELFNLAKYFVFVGTYKKLLCARPETFHLRTGMRCNRKEAKGDLSLSSAWIQHLTAPWVLLTVWTVHWKLSDSSHVDSALNSERYFPNHWSLTFWCFGRHYSTLQQRRSINVGVSVTEFRQVFVITILCNIHLWSARISCLLVFWSTKGITGNSGPLSRLRETITQTKVGERNKKEKFMNKDRPYFEIS